MCVFFFFVLAIGMNIKYQSLVSKLKYGDLIVFFSKLLGL